MVTNTQHNKSKDRWDTRHKQVRVTKKAVGLDMFLFLFLFCLVWFGCTERLARVGDTNTTHGNCTQMKPLRSKWSNSELKFTRIFSLPPSTEARLHSPPILVLLAPRGFLVDDYFPFSHSSRFFLGWLRSRLRCFSILRRHHSPLSLPISLGTGCTSSHSSKTGS